MKEEKVPKDLFEENIKKIIWGFQRMIGLKPWNGLKKN